jgi:hypothetical protein
VSERHDLLRDQRRMLHLSAIVVALTWAAAIGVTFHDVAIGLSLAALGLSMGIALLMIGEGFSGLRAELDRAEGNLQRATEAAEIIELLRSIAATLDRPE